MRALRKAELDAALQIARPYLEDALLLELGSGDGTQLRLLKRVAESVKGVDVPNGSMIAKPQPGITYYDGVNLPFPAKAFTAVYSSHTLEHVRDWPGLMGELERVLTDRAVGVHVVPNDNWRAWSWLTHPVVQPRRYLRALLNRLVPGKAAGGYTPPAMGERTLKAKLLDTLWPPRHSEFGNRFTEVLHLTPAAWRRRLEKHGWRVVSLTPLPYFYTDNLLFGLALPLFLRRALARVLGGSSLLIIVRRANRRA
jgi:SAM-dependent methyltransferase